MRDQVPDLEGRLAVWLRSRDPGPAGESLRQRVARVPLEPAPRRSILVPLFGAGLRLAAAAAALAFVAAALWLRANPVPGTAAAAPTGGWSGGGAPPVTTGALLTIAAILSGVGLAALAVVSWREIVAWRPHRPRRRTVAIAAATVAVAAAVAVPLNVAGVARYPGGPLCAIGEPCGVAWLRLSDGGGVAPSTANYTQLSVGEQGSANWSGFIQNAAPLPLVIERATPRVSDSGFVIDAVEIGPANTDGPWSGRWPSPPVNVAGSSGLDVSIRYHATTPGFHWFSGLTIEYRIGPFLFSTTSPFRGAVCATPLPAGYSCPAQWSLP